MISLVTAIVMSFVTIELVIGLVRSFMIALGVRARARVSELWLRSAAWRRRACHGGVIALG